MSRTFKRIGTSVAVGALAAAGVLATAPGASANPPAGTNIRGKESFDTDKFMDRICGHMNTAGTGFVYNIKTGQVLDYNKTKNTQPVYQLFRGDPGFREKNQVPGNHWALTPGWEEVTGNCEYPQSDSWTFWGKEYRFSPDSLENCKSLNTQPLVVSESYTTTKSYTKSVTINAALDGKVKDIFGPKLDVGFTRTWATSTGSTYTRGGTVNVSPGNEGWMNAQQQMRKVRVNPVFKVREYSWGDGKGATTTVNSWRGRGYDRIWSFGYFVDATAPVISVDEHGKEITVLKFLPREHRVCTPKVG